MNNYKQNCTKGPVYHREGHTPHFQGTVMREEGQGETIALTYNDEHGANAELIASAFNVLHETGMTPRELAEQKVELLRILNMAVNCLRVCHQELHEAGCNEAADDTHNDILVYMDTLVKYQPVTPA